MRDKLPTLFYSTREAADYIGCGVPLFLSYVKEHKWIKPVAHGKGERKVIRWHKDDLHALAHILARLAE